MVDTTGVNWGRFRLQRYESMYSIYAKFSALNGISAIEAAEYVSKTIGVARNSPFLTSELQASKLSKLLDEPLSVTLTLKRPNQYFQQWPLDILDSPSGLVSHDDVIFCLECINLDFHGLFQTSGCIPVCPIHNRPLIRFNSKAGKSGVDRIVRSLIVAYRQYNHQWPQTIRPSKSARSPSQPENILEYLYWSYHAQIRRGQFKNAILWSYRGQGFGKPDWDSLDVSTALLAMQETFSSGSEAITSLLRNFKKIVGYEQVKAYHLDSKSVQILSEAFSPGIIQLYELWWTWKGRAWVREQALNKFVSGVSKNHVHCDCQWLRHQSDKQWIESSRVMSNRSEYLCPHQYVVSFLKKKWGDLDVSVRPRERDQVHWAYVRLAKEMSNKGLVSCDDLTAGVVLDADSQRPLDLQWRLPEQILAIIERCMSTALELDLSMCSEWLTLIDRGECPSVCKTEPQIAVALLTDSTVEIVKWRVSTINAQT